LLFFNVYSSVAGLMGAQGQAPHSASNAWLDTMAGWRRCAAMPGQGVSSTFRFGQGYGQLEMGIAACKLPIQYVSPAVWKKHFRLNRDKGVSRGLVTQRLPQYAHLFARVKDDGRAEATLIALYAAEKLI
jgi:crossover junction endodeoxyribonuclease RuvC